MSNVSTKQFVPMNTEHAPLTHSPAQVNKPLDVSSSTGSVRKFLNDSSPAQKENNVTVNKEALEKLFVIFEFALKVMRSMLAGMGVLPKLPDELQAQPHVTSGPDSRIVADAGAKPGTAPQMDAGTQVKSGPDPKGVADAGVKPETAPQMDAGTQVKSGPDPKGVADAGVKPGTAPQMDAGTQVKSGPAVKVVPHGPTQVTLASDGKHVTKPATASTTDSAQNNKLSSEINVTVQVQGCHCPHTGEKVALQPGLNPRSDAQALSPALIAPKADSQPASPAVVAPAVDKQALPVSTVMPKLDTSSSISPQVTPLTVEKPEPRPPVSPDAPTPATVDPKPDTRPTPDFTAPAPDGLDDDARIHSRNRSARPSLRSRF
ncbi:hypothetical protein [Pseudomonas sp. MPB26]|uniref:hypothetical protein n=1 Tax=Pseudomonas sp. MPB26 TaxID=3388491 RepID=UPI0039848D71